MSNLTFNDVFAEIKNVGEEEKKTIEVASEVARIVGSLAQARVKQGLTQRQLADKCGIKQSAIARMESLQVIPRLDTIIKIARCLNVRINVDSSSSSIDSVGVVINLNEYQPDNQYSWQPYAINSRSINDLREELAYGTIG